MVRDVHQSRALAPPPSRCFAKVHAGVAAPPEDSFVDFFVPEEVVLARVRVFDPGDEAWRGDVVEDGGGAVGELEGEVGLEGEWGDVVCDVLAVVVEEVGVHAGVHGWEVGMDECFWVYAWWGAGGAVNGGVEGVVWACWRTGRACCAVAN